MHYQRSNATAINRHPHVFAAVAEGLAALPVPRVLSFGCSTGEEILSLSATMPRASLVGLEVAPAALAKARERTAGMPVTLELSTPEALRRHGPYDAIFAMSVLCRWPDTKDRDSIADLFPFETYCAAVASLDEVLRPGGMLAMVNASFRFTDAPVSKGYDPVPVPGEPIGYVAQFGPDNRRLPDVSPLILFRKRG